LKVLRFRLAKIKTWVDEHDPGAVIIPFSGIFELELAELSEEDRAAKLKELNTSW
jgi:obg-like ATPase 1